MGSISMFHWLVPAMMLFVPVIFILFIVMVMKKASSRNLCQSRTFPVSFAGRASGVALDKWGMER